MGVEKKNTYQMVPWYCVTHSAGCKLLDRILLSRLALPTWGKGALCWTSFGPNVHLVRLYIFQSAFSRVIFIVDHCAIVVESPFLFSVSFPEFFRLLIGQCVT